MSEMGEKGQKTLLDRYMLSNGKGFLLFYYYYYYFVTNLIAFIYFCVQVCTCAQVMYVQVRG